MEAPDLAVLIPIHSEKERLLKQNLEVFTKLEYPPNTRIYWLLSAYDKKTIGIIEKLPSVEMRNGLPAGFNRSPKINILYDACQPSLKATALNNAIKKVKPRVFAMFDVDAIPERDFLIKGIKKLDDNPDLVAVEGLKDNYNRDENWLTELSHHMYFEAQILNKTFEAIAGWHPLGGTGILMRRKALEEIGMFDRNVIEDLELSIRLLEEGKKLALFDSKLYEEANPSLIEAIPQGARWAQGRMVVTPKLKKKYPNMTLLSRDILDLHFLPLMMKNFLFWSLLAISVLLPFFFPPLFIILVVSLPLWLYFLAENTMSCYYTHKRHNPQFPRKVALYFFFHDRFMSPVTTLRAWILSKIDPFSWHHTRKEGVSNLHAFLKKIFKI